jgi:hypothetical protein
MDRRDAEQSATLNNYLYANVNPARLPIILPKDPQQKYYIYPDNNARAIQDFEDSMGGAVYGSNVNIANALLDYKPVYPTIPTTDIPRSVCKVSRPGVDLGSNVYISNEFGDLATCATTVNQLPNGDMYVDGVKNLYPVTAAGHCEFMTTGVTTNIPCSTTYLQSVNIGAGNITDVIGLSDEDLSDLYYASLEETTTLENKLKLTEYMENTYPHMMQDMMNSSPEDALEQNIQNMRVQYVPSLKFEPIKPIPITRETSWTRLEIVAVAVAITVALLAVSQSRSMR